MVRLQTALKFCESLKIIFYTGKTAQNFPGQC